MFFEERLEIVSASNIFFFFFSSKCLHLKACQGTGMARKKIKGDQDKMSKQTYNFPRWFYEAKLSVLLSWSFRTT